MVKEWLIQVGDAFTVTLGACLQLEFGQINFFDRICICLIVDLLAQATQFCECSYEINLQKLNIFESILDLFYSHKLQLLVKWCNRPHNLSGRQSLDCVDISEPMEKPPDQWRVRSLWLPDQDPRMQIIQLAAQQIKIKDQFHVSPLFSPFFPLLFSYNV